jgi:hypothetical protein
MTEVHRVQAKAIKVAISASLSDFPVDVIPVPGTPGGKKMMFGFDLVTESGQVVRATLSGAQLSKQHAAVQAAADLGGNLIFTGRLVGTELIDVGVTFVPRQPKQQEQKAA